MEIKSPWTMVYLESVDEFISFIKKNLPPTHELRSHDLFPGVKLSGELVFIVDDDTTGRRLLMDFVDRKHCEKTNVAVPTIRLFENDAEIQGMIEEDHLREFE